MLNWVEIDAAALRWNVGQFRERLESGSRFGAVVKSNAYGHGMLEVAGVVAEAGADWLCVNNVDEAIELLTGVPAGNANEAGDWPTESVNGRVQARVAQLNELRKLHAAEAKQENGNGGH